MEKDSGLNSRITVITGQIKDVLDSEKIPYTVTRAEKAGDFTSQVISFSVLKHADLIMIMTQPTPELPGFSLSNWDERLMFNEAQIPVMCVNPVELGYTYYEWS
jgi:hypothetical protein